MSLLTRVKRIEQTYTPTGQVRCIVAADRDEAEAREAQMQAAGEIDPADTVVFLLTGVPRSGRPEVPLQCQR